MPAPGIVPAPERRKRTSWVTFLKAHWGAIAAEDLFTVQVLTMHGLVRYSVLFVIDLKTRCVQIAGIAHDPHGAWMEQVARDLTDAVDGTYITGASPDPTRRLGASHPLRVSPRPAACSRNEQRRRTRLNRGPEVRTLDGVLAAQILSWVVWRITACAGEQDGSGRQHRRPRGR